MVPDLSEPQFPHLHNRNGILGLKGVWVGENAHRAPGPQRGAPTSGTCW